MSGQPTISQGSSGSGVTELSNLGYVEPALKAGDVRFQPAVTTRISGTLPWNLERDQSLAGESYIAQNGDMNLRVVIEGICFKSQLDSLFELREQAEEVRVITDMTDAAGVTTVSFDQLKVDRKAENSRGSFTYQGREVTEPLFSFQIQSKENKNSGNKGVSITEAFE